MRKLKGFTLIELLIVIAMVGILAAVILPAITGNHFSLDGTLCKHGVLFNVDANGTQQQVIGTNGMPVGCNG